MILSFHMPKSTIGENPLRFPLPRPNGPGTVTVLCGPNGGGKSFILRTLKNGVEQGNAAGYNEGHGWLVELRPELPGKSHRPHHHTVQMTSIGTLALGRAGKVLAKNDLDLETQIELFGSLFALWSVSGGFDMKQWRADPTYRKNSIEALGPVDEEVVYWLGEGGPAFLDIFRDTFGCRVGLRRPPSSVELVLGWPSGVTAPFANWSDGQKSFFTVLAVTFALEPEIYIFDEVENFLHPELISRLLDHLKRKCRQTILSSHHPHLIFGNLVDAVYYVEPLTPTRPDFAERTVKHQRQPAAPRRITKLETDTAKLASAYRLFDVRDAALLASSAIVEGAVSLHLNDAVRGLYECGAVPASTSVYMDRQSEEIAGYIGSFAPPPRRILDWGAGLGRSLDELSKLTPPNANAKLDWILYEPDPGARAVLANKPKPSDIDFVLLNDREELKDVSAGLVLLTNVLHVLDPVQMCGAIGDAWATVEGAENGLILATEIYPLLVPERNAVPIPSGWLAGLFRVLGFRAVVRSFAVQGGNSYCLAASRPPKRTIDDTALLAVIVEHWRQLGTHYLDEYEGLVQVRSLADQKQLLNATFGLARVSACLRELGISAKT